MDGEARHLLNALDQRGPVRFSSLHHAALGGRRCHVGLAVGGGQQIVHGNNARLAPPDHHAVHALELRQLIER